jgi:hypothetical protein
MTGDAVTVIGLVVLALLICLVGTDVAKRR